MAKKVKEKLSEVLELPKEVTLDFPKMEMIGDKHIIVENYKGILEYNDKKIRLNTKIGEVSIYGEKLELKTIMEEEIIIEGSIIRIDFCK